MNQADRARTVGWLEDELENRMLRLAAMLPGLMPESREVVWVEIQHLERQRKKLTKAVETAKDEEKLRAGA
jgi:hypothetical protein